MVIGHTEALGNQATSFRNELSQMSGVGGATMTSFIPTGTDRDWSNICNSAAMDLRTSMHTQFWTVDENYIPTLGMHLLAGRNFSHAFPTDSTGLIVNETAFRPRRFPGAGSLMDKKFYAYERAIEIDGVSYYRRRPGFQLQFHAGGRDPALSDPGLFQRKYLCPDQSSRYSRGYGPDQEMWRQMAPSQPFGYSFMDDSFRHLYTAEVADGVYCGHVRGAGDRYCVSGTFWADHFCGRAADAGRSAFVKFWERRVSTIVALIAKDFLGLVVLASIIAFPIADWAMSHWLLGFAYRIGISWWVFAGAAFLALLIAAVTVSYRAVRAALANPVESLRTE